MPSATLVKRSFRLEEGNRLGSFTVASSSVQHVVKTPYEKYEFPMHIVFFAQPGSTKQQLEKKLNKHIRGDEKKLIYSEQGSPYDCSFGKWKISKVQEGFAVSSLGMCVRRRDILTKSQEKATSENLRKKAELEILKSKLKGQFRFVRSRWGTSVCAKCGRPIQFGDLIAKRSGDANPGGWTHIECAAQEVGIDLTVGNGEESAPTRRSKRKAAGSEMKQEERKRSQKRRKQSIAEV